MLGHMDPPIGVMTAALGVIFTGALGAFLWQSRKIHSGFYDWRLNETRQLLGFPSGRKPVAASVPLGAIEAIEVRQTREKDSDGDLVYAYRVRVAWDTGSEQRVFNGRTARDRSEPDAIVRWLREHVNVG
jgi:hypothetical protein